MWNPALWNLQGNQTLSGEDINEYTALTYSAVYNAISLISGTIGSLPLHLMQTVGDKKKLATTHSLYRVMHSAGNPYMTAMAVRETMMAHVLAWGNGYAEIIRNGYGQIIELWPITPNRVQPKMENGEFVYKISVDGDTKTLPREKVLHIAGLGFDGFVGYSVIHMAQNSIGLGKAMESFGSMYFGQGTHPGVVVTHPSKLSDTAHKNLKDSLTTAHSGLGKSHKLLLLEEGMKLEKLGIPPNDSQFLECVTPDTLLSMADGTRVPARHINAGDMIVSWKDDKLIPARIKAVAPPKIKKLIKIKTARGRELTASEDHPCLCVRKLRTPGNRIFSTKQEKWIPLKEISIGNYVGIGLNFPEIKNDISFSDAYFLGAMVGDGYIRKGGCTFCSDNEGIIKKMSEDCSNLGGELKPRRTNNNDYNYEIKTNGGQKNGSKIRKLFNESGLVGKHSHTKFVPEIVLSGGPVAWKAFLSGYFDADGSIRSVSGKQVPALYWASTSLELLDGCQHMLAMLGVQSAIYKMWDGGRKEVMGQMCDTRESWGLYVMSNSHLKKTADMLSLSHAEKASRLAEYSLLGKSRYREINFQYDRIISVEDAGEGETIGIEVEDSHTHITNGIITHNSRIFQISDIARFFNLQIHKLKEMSKSSFNNIESEQQSFVTDSLLPWGVRLEQSYNMQLLSIQEFKAGLYFKHIFEGLLRGNSKDRAEFYAKLWNVGAITENQIREKEDMNPNPSPYADELFVPLNMIPLSKIDDYIKKQVDKNIAQPTTVDGDLNE